MKKIIALALSLIMLLSLTACTISISTNTNTDSQNTDTDSDNPGNTNTGNEGTNTDTSGSQGGTPEDELMETVVEFINEASVYLTEATDGLINVTVGAGGTIELVFNFPNSNVVEASPIIKGKIASLSSSGGIKLLADEKEENKDDSGNGTAPVIKNYTTPDALESYVVLNSINNKIKMLIGETEYFTEADFPFMEDMFGDLIGTVKFKSVFVDLLESKDEYTTQDGEFLTNTRPISVTEGIDENKVETVIGYAISGYKYADGVLSTYFKATDKEGNLTQETVYNTYELDGNNFYYESYILDENGEKVMKDMLNIIKAPTEFEDIFEYYVQAVFNSETGGVSSLTAQATVPFDEAYYIEEQWMNYLNKAFDDADWEAMQKIPTQVYAEAKFREEPDYTHYKVQYFRNYNRDTTGNEETGTYPASWKDGFDVQNVFNLEKYITESVKNQTKDYEAFVMETNGQFESNKEYKAYVPFALKEYSTTLIPNVTDIENAYRIVLWGNEYTGVSFESSDENVVTVTDDGYLLTHDEGYAIIIVKRGRLGLYFEVGVRATIASEITEMTLAEGTEGIYGVNMYGVEVEYESTNPEVAIFDPETSMIKALSVGKATIISTAVATGEVVECDVTVVPAVSVDITLNEYPAPANSILGVPVIFEFFETISTDDTVGVHITSELPQDALVYYYDMESINAFSIQDETNSYDFTFSQAGTYLIEVKYWLDSQTEITLAQITVIVE